MDGRTYAQTDMRPNKKERETDGMGNRALLVELARRACKQRPPT